MVFSGLPIEPTPSIQLENATHISSAPSPALSINDNVDTYMARYRDWLDSVPDHQRAWPIIKSVDTQLRSELGDLELVTDSLNPDLSNEWKESAAFVENHPQLLEQLRGIATKTLLGMPAEELRGDPPYLIEEFPPVLAMLLPQIGMIKTQVKLLIIDAQIANTEGDHGRVLNDIKAITTLSQVTSILNTMIGGIVSVSTENLVSSAILSGKIDIHRWSERDLNQLAAEYNKSPGWHPASQFFDGERASYQSMINWLFIDNEGGHLSQQGAQRFQNFAGNMDDEDNVKPVDKTDLKKNQLMVSIWQRLIGPLNIQTDLLDEFQLAGTKDLSEPIFNRRQLSIQLFNNKLEHLGTEFLPVGLVIADGQKFITRVKHAQTDRDATRLLIALYQHRARHDEFPQSVHEIDPDFKIQHFIDPYSGDDLKYILIDDRPVIYSVGPDRKDDGGKPLHIKLGESDRYPDFILLDEYEHILSTNLDSIDGDWILTE